MLAIGQELLDDIPRLPPLSGDDETELAYRVASGDLAAAGRLQLQWARYAVFLARRCVRFRSEAEALLSAGMVGLAKAAARWDPARSRFSTTVTFLVRSEIHKAAEKERKRGFRLSPPVVKRPVSLAAAGGVAPEGGVVAYDPADHREPAPAVAAGLSERVRLVAPALESLPEREADILRRHHFDGESIESIARSIGVTHQRVTQLAAKGRERFAREFRRRLDEATPADSPRAVARRRAQVDAVAREFAERLARRAATLEKQRDAAAAKRRARKCPK